MKARMAAERAPQLREGFICAKEAAELCGVKDVGTIHTWVTQKKVIGRRVGVGKFAPWYVNVDGLLRLHASANGAETPGSAANLAVHRLRLFIESARRAGELSLMMKPAKVVSP